MEPPSYTKPVVASDDRGTVFVDAGALARKISAVEARLYAVQRELITHVVWSRADDEGDRAYECDLCEVRDIYAGCAEDVVHKPDCILAGCENPPMQIVTQLLYPTSPA